MICMSHKLILYSQWNMKNISIVTRETIYYFMKNITSYSI